MRQLGVPILPFAGHSAQTRQLNGQAAPSFPPSGQELGALPSPPSSQRPEGGNLLRDAPPLQSSGNLSASQRQSVPVRSPTAAALSMDERLKVAEEKRRMQAELNRLTRQNAVLEARMARSKAEAGRGRGRGRTGRGNRRTSMVIDLRDPTAADPVAPAAGPSSTLSDARERPRLATAALDAPNGDANAATRLKEMQMLKAKIAAMEKRKLRRQVFSESPAGDTQHTAKRQDSAAVPSELTSDPTVNGADDRPLAEHIPALEQPLSAKQAVAADPAVQPDVTEKTVFDSEDWDDGDAGWPPPEDEEAGPPTANRAEDIDQSLLPNFLPQQSIASGSLSAGIDEALSVTGEVSRKRHKRRHGEEKRPKKDKSDRESQEERKERKRRERSSRHHSASDASRSKQAEDDPPSGDLRSRLDVERRRKRSRFAPDEK